MPAVANTLFMAQSLVLIGSGLYMLLSPDEAVRSPQLAGTPPEVLLSFGWVISLSMYSVAIIEVWCLH